MTFSTIKNIVSFYKKTSTSGKILFFIILLLIAIAIFKPKNSGKEGFEQTNNFLFKAGNEIYDDFYSSIYDHLVFNGIKNEYEVGQIINKTTPSEESIILDIGSGTGHHVSLLNQKGLKVIGIDKSSAMVAQAQKNYPKLDFVQGDVLNATKFQAESFTHILCLYFTLYYIQDKAIFFNNCYNWLMPGGTLVVHIVNRDQFDPIVPPANPLLMLTPQRYAKKRITKSTVTFDDFKYDANFVLDNNTNNASFVETFKNKKNGKIFRKQDHKMYMESEEDVLEIAKSCGFIMTGKIDLIKSGYEYNYLYIFNRPE